MTIKIDSVEVYCLQDPQADYVRFEGSFQNALVVVRADNGLYGVGETDSPPGIIRALIESPNYNHLSCGLASVLRGEVLDHPTRLWQKMFKATSWHGRHGVAIHAISALDIALWDLFAKCQNRPLHQLFGGLAQARLPAYATVYPMKPHPEQFSRQIGSFLEQGFNKIKICVEPWWQDPERVVENLLLLRRQVGKGVDLMLDVALELQHFYQLKPFVDLLEELDFKWIEAPFPLDNLADHIRLKQHTRLPLGVGDLGLTTVREYQPYLDAGVVDIAQPDITMFGGFSEALKLQNSLAASSTRIIPHGYNTEITLAVNSQFLAAQARPEPLEYSTSQSLLRRSLVQNPLQLDSDGFITIDSERPGLGVDIDWQVVAQCELGLAA